MRHTALTTLAAAALCCANASAANAAAAARQDSAALRQCSATQVEKPSYVTLGKSSVVMLPYSVVRMAVGGAQPGQRTAMAQPAPNPALPAGLQAVQPPAPAAAQEQDGVSEVRITLLAPNELFVLGRKAGSMNVILQDAEGRCHVKDIVVTVDPETLQSLLADLVPEEIGRASCRERV